MRLKRLELSGFKSFADKTVLDFSAGITAVVGPNGSGKSNIIDAIRWLLGEREAKSMRSLKAEDLIFAGTEKRPRMSLAQAAMVFDNANRFFPVDFAEVAVRRRIERDGTSRYFLNDAEVRLKDAIDFFAQSRLGTKGFSIINQGESDLFVRSAPRERRAMLEEILGLRQYQLKKHEAELKLRGTRANMEKAQGLIEEIRPHLRLLHKQTAKWEKHEDLAKELETLTEGYLGHKLFEIERDRQASLPKLTELQKALSERGGELATLEKELRTVEAARPKEGGDEKEVRAGQQQLLGEKAELQKALGRLEARIELLVEAPQASKNAEEAVTLLEEARAVLEDALLESDIEVVHGLLKALFEKVNDLLDVDADTPAASADADHAFEEEEEVLLEKLRAIDDSLARLGEREAAVSHALRGFHETFKAAYEAVEEKRRAVHALEERVQRARFEGERIAMRTEELEREASQLGRDLSALSPQELEDAAALPQMERRIFKLRADLADIGEIDEGLIKEATETEARYEHLGGQLADLERAYADLVGLITELDVKIHSEFKDAIKKINEAFHEYFRMMFGGGQAKLVLEKRELPPADTGEGEVVAVAGEADENHAVDHGGIDISVSIPRKRITGLDMLSGGEKTLVSIAVLFALISVSPPPFLVLDEVDAALDEANTRRFANLVKEFSKKTQFIMVTHNRATMEASDILYGITMEENGTSKVLSLKFEE